MFVLHMPNKNFFLRKSAEKHEILTKANDGIRSEFIGHWSLTVEELNNESLPLPSWTLRLIISVTRTYLAKRRHHEAENEQRNLRRNSIKDNYSLPLRPCELVRQSHFKLLSRPSKVFLLLLQRNLLERSIAAPVAGKEKDKLLIDKFIRTSMPSKKNNTIVWHSKSEQFLSVLQKTN